MHHLHRLHTARSVVTTSLSSTKRAFGFSARVFQPNSDRRSSPIHSDNPLLAELVRSLPARPYANHAGTPKRRKKEKQPRKKKVESKGKRDRATIERARASLADFDAKRTGVIQKLSEGSEETFAPEAWLTGWGEDGTLSLNALWFGFHPVLLQCSDPGRMWSMNHWSPPVTIVPIGPHDVAHRRT